MIVLFTATTVTMIMAMIIIILKKVHEKWALVVALGTAVVAITAMETCSKAQQVLPE